jgi:hypothetical protein
MDAENPDPSGRVPDAGADPGVAAAVVHGMYCQLVARQILADLPADAMAQLLEAERTGTLDLLLSEAVRRARVQAAAVRDLNARIDELIEPLSSALSPRNRHLYHRVIRDVS